MVESEKKPTETSKSALVLGPDVRQHAEWFVWAHRAGGDVIASHRAAQAATAALGSGQDAAAATKAARAALRGGAAAVPVEPLVQKYSGWFAVANADLGLDIQRSHAFAEAGLRAADSGQDIEAATRAAELAAEQVAGPPAAARPARSRSLLAGVGLVLLLAIAGGGGWVLLKVLHKPATAPGSAQSGLLQSGDLPADLKLCAESGDINSYLTRAQSTSPDSYKSLSDDWHRWQQAGAQQGWVTVYTNKSTECTHLTGASNVDAQARYVSSVVFGFKDTASAVDAYTKEKNSSQTPDAPVAGLIIGAATGLGPNSVTATPFGPFWLFAGFQAGPYLVLYDGINLQPAEDKTATGNIYRRASGAGSGS